MGRKKLSRQATPDREPIWAPLSGDAGGDLPLLEDHAEVDVCIVGAGIAGLTTAYLLGGSGRKVMVLEQERIGAGETGRTTAHLTCVLDTRYHRLRQIHGEERARQAAESHVAAIDLVESVVRAEAVDCGFRRVDGYLVAEDAAENLEQERDAARALGLPIELLPKAPLPYPNGQALRIENQAQLDPLRYLAGLARAFRKRGGTLVRARAAGFEGDGGASLVRTDGGPVVRARSVVVASHAPINQRIGVHAKQSAYRTYVIGALMPRGSVPPGLYWDTLDSYHYLRVVEGSAEDRDTLLVGGEDHKTGQADDADERIVRLERWARERFPGLTDMTHRWSGQVLEPSDGLAHIGRDSDATNVYVATGFGGNGMTYGTLAGRLIADQVLGRDNRWTKLYDPARVTAKAVGRYLETGVDAVARYGEWVSAGEVASPRDVPAGSGAVMREGLAKHAVYRDAAGEIHRLSAVCPHLGCIVHWNDAEKTWDCPCHGSRFAANGAVLNGPATKPLAPSSEEAKPPASRQRRRVK